LLFSWIKRFVCAASIIYAPNSLTGEESVFLGNGIKVGEVSHHSAIVWVRLTQSPEPVYPGTGFSLKSRSEVNQFQKMDEQELGPEGRFGYQLPEGFTLGDATGALPGASGDVRLTCFEAGKEAMKMTTDWQRVDPNRDHTHRFSLEKLNPKTKYTIAIEARKNGSARITATLHGGFTTAARKDRIQKVTFTVATCTKFNTRDAGKRGYQIFDSMLTVNPSFFVHAGDNVYYDHFQPFATHIDLARYFWNRTYSLSYTRTFLQSVPAYFMKDDHDSWDNDSWPTMTSRMGAFTYEDGRKVYDEQVPMSDPRHYRTFRWGKDLQIWLVEVRDFRDPNFHPDGPNKSIWGKEQLDWFRQTVQASDATFKFLISPTPLIGPDHLWKAEKSDNHVDPGWTYEGDLLRSFIGQHDNMYVICGDRHWQYISRHPETGILEYGCGAATDEHATPLQNPNRSMHLYYGENKGGFLSVTIDRINDVPTAFMRHHGVRGDLLNEDVRTSEK